MDARARAFAEEAIRSVGRGDAPAARTFVSLAFEADHRIGPLADAIHLACAEIDELGEVSAPTWNTLADAVDSADLQAVVEGSRG
jgi:hypothetical protein